MKRWLSLALVGLLTVGPAFADGKDCQVELQVLRVPAAEHAFDHHYFMGHAALAELVHKGRAQRLETLSTAGQVGQELTVLSGQKIPLGFVDPRAGQYQVQYVDCGLKALVKIQEDPGHGYRVETNSEKMGLEDPGTTGLPYLQGVQVNTVFLVEPGQVALFARTHGLLSRALKLAWPGVNFSASDTVIFGLSIDSP